MNFTRGNSLNKVVIIVLVAVGMFSVGIISGNPDRVALAANPVLEEIFAILTDSDSGNQAISDKVDAMDSKLTSIENRLTDIEAALNMPPMCSDSTVDPGEVCDDGNNINGDGCSADCQSVEICGNGITDFSVGEMCDDGNTIDDGNGCSATCKLNNICGNGVTEELVEECDDGNNINGDGCSALCVLEF